MLQIASAVDNTNSGSWGCVFLYLCQPCQDCTVIIPLSQCAFCTHSAHTETKVVLVACPGILITWSFGFTNKSHILILAFHCLYIYKSVDNLFWVLLQGREGLLLKLFVVRLNGKENNSKQQPPCQGHSLQAFPVL